MIKEEFSLQAETMCQCPLGLIFAGVWHVIFLYQVDFSSALRIARKYFWRDSRTEKDIIHLMIKYVHAVKEELRQFSRPLRGIGAVHFAFR